MPALFTWNQIKHEFQSSLILGNGASIAIHADFKYSSLLETARYNGYLTDAIEKIFCFYKTSDFEFILNRLWHAFIINQNLDIEEEETEKAYKDLRTALIESIRQVHASYEKVSPHLQKMFTFMKRFNKVINLNYDLLVYWAMMAGNDSLGNWFKDCFLHGYFQEDWKWFERPAVGVEGTTLVFYPHGSLFLATDKFGADIKLAKASDTKNILNRVVECWESGKFIPLFVSEGESIQKIQSIGNSFYQSTILYDVLPNCGEDVVIYGWSLCQNDDHIIKRISRGNVQKIAVSVYCENRSESTINEEIEFKKRKLINFLPSSRISFYDAQSSGCWIF